MKKAIIILSILLPAFGYTQNYGVLQKIVANDRDLRDEFGTSVSISGNYAVVGSPKADHPLFGSLVQSGAAYIYEKNISGNWNQIQKIQPAAPSDQERGFGYSVSISGDYILIGCPKALLDENGLNQIAGSGNLGVGAAFVYERSFSGTWHEVQKIVASDRAFSDQFGLDVDISGDRAIIGACWEDEDAFGGNTKDYAGSAYIFERNTSGNWNEVQKIVAADRGIHHKFGWSVSIEQDQAIVSAVWENSSLLGHEGAVYVFKRYSGGTWSQIQKIKHSDMEWMDNFGYSVSISGDYFIAGAPIHPKDTLGLNSITASGAAYIFKKNLSGTWYETQKIIASDRSTDDNFGQLAEISGDKIIIGVPQEDHDVFGQNYMGTAGSAYIFEKTISGNWVQIQKVVAPDRSSGDGFGNTVAISTDDIMVGAATEDHDIMGLNFMDESGSVYVIGECFATNSTIIEKACNSYTAPYGTVYDSSGIYVDTITNSAGCDSIITLFLTITDTSSSTISPTSCNSYTSPSGIIYNNSGTYLDTIMNNAGCDSIITIHLTIDDFTLSTINETACNSYTSPSGVVYDTSGMYLDTILNNVGCDSIITIYLNIISDTTIDVSANVTSSLNCNGDNDGQAIVVVNTGTAPYTYQWDDPALQTTKEAWGLYATTYNVMVTDSNGCVDSSTVIVSEPDPLKIDSMTILSDQCEDGTGSISLFPEGGTPIYTYLWNTTPSQSNETIESLFGGNYSVSITDANGCDTTAVFELSNENNDDCDEECSLFIPNVITPNGNGWNDTWQIKDIDCYPNCLVKVYNRWGIMLFESKGYPTKWDGRYQGKELPAGVYYYIIDLNDDETQIFKGSISIFFTEE